MIYRETGDPIVLGLFGAVRVIPYIVLSVPAGIVADRYDRRLVLLVTDLARAACMVAMTFVLVTDGPIAALIGLSILAACFSTFFYPAIGAYVPNLVKDERQLGPANSLYASLDNLGFVVGPVLGGILVATRWDEPRLRLQRADVPRHRLDPVGTAAVLERSGSDGGCSGGRACGPWRCGRSEPGGRADEPSGRSPG